MDFKTKYKENHLINTFNLFFNGFNNKSNLYNEKIGIYKYENNINIFFLLYLLKNNY